MTDRKAALQGSVDTKIEEISSYIRDRVLVPAEDEREEILKAAKKEAQGIIDKAQADADGIRKKAEEKNNQDRQNFEASLRIAARQAVDALKMGLEKEVLRKVLDENVTSTLTSETVVTELVKEAIHHYMGQNNEDGAQLVLPESLKSAVSSYVQSEIRNAAENGITIADETVPAGFSLRVVDSGLTFDFTDQSVRELLGQFMREEIRSFLFSD